MTLKVLRQQAGLTQEFVALKLNVTQGAVSKWETGEGEPLRKYRKTLRRLYKCDADTLDKAIEESMSQGVSQ